MFNGSVQQPKRNSFLNSRDRLNVARLNMAEHCKLSKSASRKIDLLVVLNQSNESIAQIDPRSSPLSRWHPSNFSARNPKIPTIGKLKIKIFHVSS